MPTPNEAIAAAAAPVAEAIAAAATAGTMLEQSLAHTPECAAQHFAPWMIEEHWFRSAVDAVKAGTLQPKAFSDEDDDEPPPPPYTVHNGTAVIAIAGAMMKKASKFGGTSSVATRSAIRKAVHDDKVQSILLHIDSPGGTVAGTADLAADVRAANTIKPVHAYIEDLGASAAYWVASQARRVTANATGRIGSIGTLLVLDDTSGMYAAKGVKVHVISTGKFKGAGTDGAPITDEHLAMFQTDVNDLNEHFLRGVAEGRQMPIGKVREVADGRVHIASKAKEMGLIDAVASLEQAFAAIQSESQPAAAISASAPTEPTSPEAPPVGATAETPSPAAPLESVSEEAHNERISAMSNPTTAAPAQGSAAGTSPVSPQSSSSTDNPVRAEVMKLEERAAEAHFERGKRVGREEMKQEMERSFDAIVDACPGKPEMAIHAIRAHQTPEAVKLAFEATAAAEKAAEARIEAIQLENRRQIALAATGGYAYGVEMGMAGADDEPQQDPKQQAENEWDHRPAVRKGFSSKERYVNFRTAELRGQFTRISGPVDKA